MRAASTISQLLALEPMLRADGVCGQYLIGSRARGDDTQNSDVDLLLEISPGSGFSLFDKARISRQLSETKHSKVDFIPRCSLHPWIKARVEAKQVKVFG